MHTSRCIFWALGGTLLLAGCQDGPTSSRPDPAVPAAGAAQMDPLFARAGAEFGVPTDLLKAISFTETRWYMVPGAPSEIPNLGPAWGVMALRGERLERGAQLAGVSVRAAQTEPLANIRAGAALLRAEADAQRIDRSDLGAWAPAVARFSGVPSTDAQADYVHRGVYRTLREGVSPLEQTSLHATLAPHGGVTAAFTRTPDGGPRYTTQYGPAIWSPSPNYTGGRTYGVSLLVIHTCAGAYSGCWGWLTNSASRVSAHYVVSEGSGEVRQLVDERNTAWHVGAYFNGLPTNPRSIGIEHGGYSYTSSNAWPGVQYTSSSKLSCDIVKSWSLIRDRQHIIGHYQADPVNRANDPGTSFPWADYMNKLNQCVTGSTGSTAITIDSNQGRNGSNARMTVSGNWASSTSTAGYYGTGYWYANTAAVSDPADFEFYLPAAASKAVYAWWTAGSNRAPSAPFIVYNAAGTKLGTVNKNQQTGGGAWQYIGTYGFSTGWNKVALSRWTTSGYVVVADAVQIR